MKTFAVVLGALAVAAVAQTAPKFANDWSGIVAQGIVISQGGQQNGDGSICCSATSPECKVQTEYQAGRQFFSVTQQMSKLANADGSGIVSDFNPKVLKEYQVGPDGVCQQYCPIPADQAPLTPIGLPPNSTFMGSQTGKYCMGDSNCVMWQNLQKPMFNITFQTLDFYMNDADATNTVPLAQYITLTPFGMPMGYQTMEWQDYKAGAIDPTTFKVINASTCPLAQCGGDGDGDSDSTSSSPSSSSSPSQGVVSAFARDSSSDLMSELSALSSGFKGTAPGSVLVKNFIGTFSEDKPAPTPIDTMMDILMAQGLDEAAAMRAIASLSA